MTDRYASLKQGLVGCWIPSVSGSGLLLPDLSGRGNNGALTNMDASDWVSGQYGRALDFDGSNDKVELGARDLLRQPLSISAWAYRRSSNANHTIIDGATDSSNSFGAHLRFTTANKIRWYFNNANLSSADTTTTPSLNAWHHVIGTFDGVTSRIYFNGVLEASTTGDAFGTAAGNYRIGCLSTVYGADVGVMDGLIDDIRIYNRALTESEIRLLASRPGIGLQPSPTRFIAREKKTGLRRKILTGQT